MATDNETRFVSGFVSILGRPNAGKSTLLNALVGAKVAIVSDKPQTTRTAIQGILNLPGAQVVFMDTPGVHQGAKLIHRRMMDTLRAALSERDLLIWMVDAAREFEPPDAEAVALLKRVETPCLLVLNKIDLARNKQLLLPLIARYNELAPFTETFPVSAASGDGLADLRDAILGRLPEGPQYFPPDFITDQPERFLAAELIREKVLEETRQEVPHAVAVIVDAWRETPKLLRIAASVVVERTGQKRIVIGTRGAMLKQIGSRARLEMERLFGRRIFLELFVKVRPGWRENPEFLNEIDWRYMAGGEAR